MTWSKHEIATKIIYLKKVFKKTADLIEKEKILYSLETLRSIQLSKNIVDSDENFSHLVLDSKLMPNILKESIVYKNQLSLDTKYTDNLVQAIVNMVVNKKYKNYSEKSLIYKKYSESELIAIAKDFYSQLDSELYELSLKSLDKKNHALMFNSSDSKSYGITFYDYHFNKAYCKISYSNNYTDILTTVHEVMHATEFEYNDTIVKKKYPILTEIAPKTIEYLLYDYLLTNDFNKDQVNILKQNRIIHGVKNASRAHKIIKNPDEIDDLRSNNYYYNNEIKTFMDTVSSLVATYLYLEIKKDKQIGLEKLKKLMKNPILINEIPDFSFIGFDAEVMLEVALNYGLDDADHRLVLKKKV